MSHRARVLIVEPQSEPGGLWHYALALAHALQNTDFEVALATLFPFEPLPNQDGLAIRSIGNRTRRINAGFSLWNVQNTAGRLMRLFGVIRTLQTDVIHLHSPLGRFDFAYFHLLRALGKRVVYTAHDAYPLRRGVRWSDIARYRAADAIIVHSRNAVQDLLAAGISQRKIVRIGHGNYLHFCENTSLSTEDARRTLGLPADSRVVLFFGTIAAYKGLDLLIEAFSHLHRWDRTLYLLLAGEPLEDFEPYSGLIHRLGVADRVVVDLRYIPFAEVPRYFLAADVVAFPYRQIYQSGVLQLAYGFARPVVVTDVGGLGESVREDRTGVVVLSNDAEGFAFALRHMLSNPESAQAMGSRARRVAEDKYSWEQIARRIGEVYESCLGRRH